MKHTAALPRQERGFTLVELLVTLAIGLVIMAALVAVYSNLSRANSEMGKTSSMVESGRFGIDLLQDDVQHAGYWGGFVPRHEDLSRDSTFVPHQAHDVPSVIPDPCLSYSSTNWNTTYTAAILGMPVQAYQATPSANFGCSLASLKANTDVLVVRHAEGCTPGTASCAAYDTGKLYFQASTCATDANRTLIANGATTTFNLKKRDCTAVAEYRRLITNIYYIRTYANTTSDGIPTLVRVSLGTSGGSPAFEAPVALVEGVENMVVELGIDSNSRCGGANDYTAAITRVTPPSATPSCSAAGTTAQKTMPTNRGDGVPERFVRCGTSGCALAELRDVVAVKVHLLARARDLTGGYTDARTYTLGSGYYPTDYPGGMTYTTTQTATITPSGTDVKYKRQVFETTIRLTNVSGRRETI